MKNYLIIVLFLAIGKVSYGQNADSLILTFDEFYQLVLANHPVAKQASLLSEQARAQLRLARGGFDPKLGFTWDRKDFKETEYYNKIEASLKIPTWLGVTPEIGFNQNEGQYLNNENFISETTDNQQVYAGVGVTVGRGLFIDERRATLAQAKLFQNMAEAEQISMLNKLLLAAAKEYWSWYNDYYNTEVLRQNILLSEDIFERTKLGFEYGEVAAIDTVQAKTNLLTRQAELIEAQIALRNASLKLATYLWNDQGIPFELRENVRPQQTVTVSVNDDQLIELKEIAQQQHPELLKLRIKAESLGVDRRLARENLKPQLDLKYHLLDQPITPDSEFSSVQLEEDYRFGIDFSIPLFLRKERAKVNQVELKLESNALSQNLREREIINNINAIYFELVNTNSLIDQQQQMVENYQLLVDAERLNLANGESDLFKLNAQLDKLLANQSKLIKVNARYRKLYAELLWAAGIENLQLN